MNTKNLKIALFAIMLSLTLTSCSSYHDMLYGDIMREQMERDGARMGEWKQAARNVWIREELQ